MQVRLHLLRFEQNHGSWLNFNRTFIESCGDYFSWLAHDDYLYPEYIARLAAALDENPDAVAAVPWVSLNGPERGFNRVHREGPGVASSDLRVRLRAYLRRDAWYFAYGLKRRESLLNTQLFRPEWGADVLLDFELLMTGRFVVVPEALLEYQVHENRKLKDILNGIVETTRETEVRFPALGLWRSLWRLAGTRERSTQWKAKTELLGALTHRSWRYRIAWDFSFEIRRALSHRHYVVALAWCVPMCLLSPSAVLSGVRRYIRGAR